MSQAWKCEKCKLWETKGARHVLVSGPAQDKCKAVVIVESPTITDSQNGHLFSGDSMKKEFETMLAEAGLLFEEVAKVALVACCPPRNEKTKSADKLLDSQIEACWPNVEHTLNFYKPKFILLLGAVPVKVFLNLPTLSRASGRVFDSSDCKGIGFSLSGETKKVNKTLDGVKTDLVLTLNKPGIFKILATQSPAAILRDPAKKEEAMFAMKQFGDLISGKVVEKPETTCKIAYTEPEAYSLLSEIYERTKTEKKMGFDIETSGFYWYQRKFNSYRSQTLSCAFGFRPHEVFGVCLRPQMRSDRIMALFQKILQSDIPKGGHNGKFDNVFLRGELGWAVKNFVFDTMVASYALNQDGAIGLGDLSPIYRPDLGRYWEDIESKYLDRKKTGYLNAPDKDLLEYNCKDVDVTMTLWEELPVKLNKEGKEQLFHEILMPHQREIEEMEYYGIKTDIDKTMELGKIKLTECLSLEAESCAALGRCPEWWGQDATTLEMHGLTEAEFSEKKMNLNSGQQLGKILFEELKLPIKKYSPKPDKQGKKRASVDEEALEAIRGAHPAIPLILEWRGVFKQLSTYLGWEQRDDGSQGVKTGGTSLLALVDVNGRVHCNFSITTAVTGRSSSARPNLQNIPKLKVFRDLFMAEDGFDIINSDFAGLELRVLANVSNDPAMIEAFNRNIDPHASTASEMFGIPLADFRGVIVTKVDGSEVIEGELSLSKAKEKYPDAIKLVDRKDRKERKAGKTLNFGIAYGKGADSLSEELGISKEEAEDYLIKWSKARPGATKWIKNQHAFVENNGYVRYSLNRTAPLLGTKAIHSDGSPDRGARNEALRCSVNYPIQGCLPYTTRVTTNKGLLQIGDLYTGKEKASKVWDGKGWRRFSVVNRGSAELIEVTTMDGTRFVCDDRHEVLCHTMRGGVKFRNITTLYRWGTRMCASHHTPMEFGYPAFKEFVWDKGHTNNSRTIHISSEDLKEFWFSIGYHLGDGYYSHETSINYVFGKKDLSTNAVRLSTFFEKIGAGKIKIRRSVGSRGEAYEGAIHSKGVLAAFKVVGYLRALAKTKRVPFKLWKETLENRKAFLEGYYASDGSKHRPFGTVQCANQELLKEVRQIMFSVGIFSHLGLYKNGTGMISAHAPGQSRAHGIGHGKRFYGLHPDYDFRTFREFRRLGRVENTYTLAVLHNDHRFDSEGIISKNTGSDCTSISIIRIGNRLRKEIGAENARLVSEVHDEILVECRKEFSERVKALVIEEMEKPMPMLSPAVGLEVDCSIKQRWGDGLN